MKKLTMGTAFTNNALITLINRDFNQFWGREYKFILVMGLKFNYNLSMKFLPIDLRRRPTGRCSMTTICRLSLPGFEDVPSSIVSRPLRTHIRATGIRRLVELFYY